MYPEEVNRGNYLLMNEFLLSKAAEISTSSIGRYRSYFFNILIWAGMTDLADVPDLESSLFVFLEGKELKRETIRKTLSVAKQFFEWALLSHPRKYRQKVTKVWINSLKIPPGKQFSRERESVTEEEILAIARIKVSENNYALIRDIGTAALLFCSGMRVGAGSTLPIGNLDLENLEVHQFPSDGVKTKNNQKATTHLLNIPELLVAIKRWDHIIRPNLPSHNPWFASINSKWGEQEIVAKEAAKNSSQNLSKRLKLLFEKIGRPPKSAHKFRHGHAIYGLLNAKTIADFKAISQNLMHADIFITDRIYSVLDKKEQKKRIGNLSSSTSESNPQKDLEEILKHFQDLTGGDFTISISPRD